MITIVNLKDVPQHLETLAKWHHAEWSHYNPGESLEQRIERMQEFLNGDLIPGTFVAKDKALLGSAAIVANDMASHPELTPWLASVYVSPDSRCKGAGSKLVSHVMETASAECIEALYLFTPDKEKFYQKLGWETIDTENYHGHIVTIMKARLQDK